MPARRVFGEIRDLHILIRSYNYPHEVRKAFRLNAFNLARVKSLIHHFNHSPEYDELNVRLRQHLDSIGVEYDEGFKPVNETIPTMIYDTLGHRVNV